MTKEFTERLRSWLGTDEIIKKCFFEYYRAAISFLVFSKFVSGQNSPNSGIWLVLWADGLLRSWQQTRAELLPDELYDGFFRHVKVYIIIAKNNQNRPRSIYQTSKFGVVFFVSKSLLGIERRKKLKNFAILTRKPRSHVRILIYRTWPIVTFSLQYHRTKNEKLAYYCLVMFS